MGFFMMNSCSDKEEPIGTSDDNIKLSRKSAIFTSKTDSVTIQTQGTRWWINHIVYADSVYFPATPYNLPFKLTSINTNSFAVEHREKNSLFIKMNENRTGIERELKIIVQDGNYFDYVRITQGAKLP